MLYKSLLELFCQGCEGIKAVIILTHNLYKQKMMQEENKINEEGKVVVEAESEVDSYQEEGNTKLKLVALFVVAVLVGVVIKAQATKTITMGFDDYRVDDFKSDFDLTKEKEVPTSSEEQGQGGAGTAAPAAPAPSCGG